MNNLQQTRLNVLNEKLCRLLDSPQPKETDIDKLCQKIKQAETEKKQSEIAQKVDTFNTEQAKQRGILKQLLALEMPSEDITNNDGSLHAVKLKRVKGLEKLTAENYNVSFSWGYRSKVYETANVGGKRYQLLKRNYNGYGKEDTFEPFEDFAAACYQNGIQPKDLKLSKVFRDIEKIEAEGERIKQAADKYSDKLKALDCYTLQNVGVLKQQNRSFYTYFK
jgi:hypothetical protein